MSDRQIRNAVELARRRNDGLGMFRAFPTQLPFFQSQCSEFLLRGGNRAGKTISAAAKFAAVVRGKPIHDKDGNPIEQRLPWQLKRPLLAWVVGLQWDHIGDTIWRVLFKRGLYRILRDQPDGSGPWRAFDPAIDAGRELDCRPSFPLIPLSEVEGGMDGIGWENKKERQFSHIPMKNGTVIKAWASTGEVKQGDPVDYIWVDERISIPGHYAEWQARLSDTKGRIVWSTMPRADNGAMIRLSHRAQEQAEEVQRGERESADCDELTLRFSANPHIDDDEKRKRLDGWSDDDRRMRDEGEFLTDTIKIYPTFDRAIHRAIYENPDQDDAISKVLRERNGEPPADWTRELILDPGTAKPAVLFCAVPPPEFWEGHEPSYVPYAEIYIPRLDARGIAKAVKAKAGGYQFQRFIIDGQASRQTPMGFSGTVGANYSKEFQRLGILCQETQSNFIPGDPDFAARKGLVETMMSYRPSGCPQLRIVTKRCPNLVWQIENNLKKTVTGPEGITIVEEKAATGQRDDVRVCFDEKTEALTDSGWKPFRDVVMSDKLATSNLKSNRMEYQSPTGLIAKRFSGEMIEFGGHKLNAMVTPDHRMVVYPRFEDESPVMLRATDMRRHDRLKMHAGIYGDGKDYDVHLVPKPPRSRGGEFDMDAGDFAEFIGWYVAEGCSDSNPRCPGNGYRVQISQTKTKFKPVLEPLLDSMPWKWTRYPQGYSCSSKQLWHHVNPIGNVYTKRVPDWVKWASPRIIRRFIAGYLMGDGWIENGTRRRSSTACLGLADDIQELYLKLGISASIKEKEPKPWNIKGRSGMSRRQYIVSELEHPRAGLHRHSGEPNHHEKQYDGMVYCATVPNGTLVVRRNGSPLVAGNCLEYWASRHPTYKMPDLTNVLGGKGLAASQRFDKWYDDEVNEKEEQDEFTVYCGPGTAA